MTSAFAVKRWVALPQPWTLVDKEYMFEEFVNQPAFYQKWLEYRTGKGHALMGLAENVSLVEYLVARKSGNKEHSMFDLNDPCDYLWTLEKAPFDALKRAVNRHNFQAAQYIYNRIKPLCNRHFDMLVDIAIVDDMPDILEMLLDGINTISDEAVHTAMTEGSKAV
jgi:hypothetical protein